MQAGLKPLGFGFESTLLDLLISERLKDIRIALEYWA